MLRLERFAFVNSFDQCEAAIEELELEIAALQGIISDTVHLLEDHQIKVETLMNRRRKTASKLEGLIEGRRQKNAGKDDAWIQKTRWMLPIPVPAIELDKRWEVERLKQKHDLEWWIDKYTRPTESKVRLDCVRRDYEKPWIEGGKRGSSSLGGDATLNGGAEVSEDGDPSKVLVGAGALQRTAGKTKNKYACFSVYRGGFKLSKAFCMVHVIRKPPKGYSLGGFVVACYCTKVTTYTGKLSDLPPVVTKEFVGDVLKVFKEHYPDLTEGARNEQDEWRAWCQYLRLAREILPDGRASGRVKLVWSLKELEGEIYKSLLEEGEEETMEVRHPVGILWTGGVRLPVMSTSHVSRKDEIAVEGDGVKLGEQVSKEEAGVYLRPSQLYNYVGQRYYIATITGFRGSGYELSGLRVDLFDVTEGRALQASSAKISWNAFKEMLWDRGKLGKKEAADLQEFAKSCVVVTEANGTEDILCFDKTRHDETRHIFSSDSAVIGGKNAVLQIVGLHSKGLLGFGRAGGIIIKARIVWEGVLRETELEIGMRDLGMSGYKCGWSIEDDGKLNYFFEPRHKSKLLKSCMFVFDDGDRNKLRLDWAPSRIPLYKKMGYIGGAFACSSITFSFSFRGSLHIRSFVVSSGFEGSIEIDEAMLVRSGRRKLAQNIANATEKGLSAILDR